MPAVGNTGGASPEEALGRQLDHVVRNCGAIVVSGPKPNETRSRGSYPEPQRRNGVCASGIVFQIGKGSSMGSSPESVDPNRQARGVTARAWDARPSHQLESACRMQSGYPDGENSAAYGDVARLTVTVDAWPSPVGRSCPTREVTGSNPVASATEPTALRWAGTTSGKSACRFTTRKTGNRDSRERPAHHDSGEMRVNNGAMDRRADKPGGDTGAGPTLSLVALEQWAQQNKKRAAERECTAAAHMARRWPLLSRDVGRANEAKAENRLQLSGVNE